MKHGYSKNRAIIVSGTFWVLIPLGYCCLRTLGVPKKFKQKKKKSFSVIFSFGYITKIDKSNEGGGNINFRYNYMHVHFFHLFF
jgi:hypothetical protein